MLDIAAFSNALRNDSVSFIEPLGVHAISDRSGAIVSITGEDAVVFPLARDGGESRLALRLPLDPASFRRWPAHYADLGAATGAVGSHLPHGITILDVEDVPGIDVALVYDWVPGETLTTRVARARERVARDRLADLLWPLADLAEALQLGGMTHGDIAPGNLIVRPDGFIVLVDLDRVGFRDAGVELEPRRRAGYRLPRGGGSAVEEDAFALLVLAVTCSILGDANMSTDHEGAPAASHPMLLFSSWDLMDPQRSRLARDIEPQLSQVSRELLALLFAACNGPAERLPSLLHEAVRVIRAHGSRPQREAEALVKWQSHERTDVLPTPADPWHGGETVEAAVASVGWPEMSGPDRLATEAWPEPDLAIRPTPSARTPGGRARTASEILEDLRTSTRIALPRTDTARRQRRADARRQRVAEQLRGALTANDRAVLVDLAMSGALAELGDSDRDDVVKVVRALAHDSISRAIASDDDERIVAAVDESVFAQDSDLDPAFRERVRLARDRARWTGRLLAAVREHDGRGCAALLGDPPAGGRDRLPQPVRRQAQRLAELHDASAVAQEAIRTQDPNGLARALGRLVVVRPAWTDHVEPAAVIALLGVEQIEHRLVSMFANQTLRDEDQWMVDIVIAAGRLPEVTRLAGLAPKDVDRLIYRRTKDASPAPA